jgi:hypothetical protein
VPDTCRSQGPCFAAHPGETRLLKRLSGYLADVAKTEEKSYLEISCGLASSRLRPKRSRCSTTSPQ